MNPSDLSSLLLEMDPEDISLFFKKLSLGLSAKAESIYSLNPEDNGALAQPYADIANLTSMAADVFTKPMIVPELVDEPGTVVLPTIAIPAPWAKR